MPNWCYNTLEIRGERGEVDAFLGAVEGVVDGEWTPIDFSSTVPYPEEYRRLDEVGRAWDEEWERRGRPPGEWKDRPVDGFNSGGNDWCVANWGTKWNAVVNWYGEYRRRAKRFGFSTAWSPPLPWVLETSRLFPELKFSLRYWEGASGFKGHFVARAGETLKDEEGDYHGPRGG